MDPDVPEKTSEPEVVAESPSDTEQDRLEQFMLEQLMLEQGNWRYEDGARICEGYLTRYEDEDYCASEIPDDWEPFEYDGRTYYVQPLSGTEERAESEQ